MLCAIPVLKGPKLALVTAVVSTSVVSVMTASLRAKEYRSWWIANVYASKAIGPYLSKKLFNCFSDAFAFV